MEENHAMDAPGSEMPQIIDQFYKSDDDNTSPVSVQDLMDFTKTTTIKDWNDHDQTYSC